MVSVLAVVIVTGLGWYLLKNHHQESVVKGFLGDLSRGDYQAAYRDWGCGSGKPCTGYDYQKFLSDWGPAPTASTAGGSSVAGGALIRHPRTGHDSESCNNGVLLTVEVNRTRMETLVDKASDSINFAPYPICPHKNPFAIMIHRTIGQLRKPLLK